MGHKARPKRAGRTDPHENYDPNWVTSPEWRDWVHRTMGGIDLDPCTTEDNPMGARRFFTPRHDGLSQPWRHPSGAGGLRVYCNPPGSNSVTSVKPWWAKAMRHLLTDRGVNGGPSWFDVGELTWCYFNWEGLLAVRSVGPTPFELTGTLVIPFARTSFFLDGARYESPRNRAAFWTTVREVPPTPHPCLVVPTGPGLFSRSGPPLRQPVAAVDASRPQLFAHGLSPAGRTVL